MEKGNCNTAILFVLISLIEFTLVVNTLPPTTFGSSRVCVVLCCVVVFFFLDG